MTTGKSPLTTRSIPSDVYHADQVADQPTLSASIACTLIDKTPAHAFQAHPKLNPLFTAEAPKDHFDLGNVVHQILLEGRDPADIVHVAEGFDDWKKQAARDERDQARATGKIPILAKQLDGVLAMTAAARAQLAASTASPAPLTGGQPEQTIVWDEDGILCRSRIDYLRDDYTAVDDVKTSARGADPGFFARKTIYDHGYDLKAAMYLRAVKAVSGIDAVWRWIVIDTAPPYLVSVVTPSDEVLAIGNAKLDKALEIWRDCLTSGIWPGYGSDVHVAEAPAWQTRWLDTTELEELAWAQM